MSTKKKPRLSLSLGPVPAKAPKPAKVDDAKAAAFVSEEPARKRGRPVKADAKRTTWERVTFYLPPGAAKGLRVRAAEEERDISDILAELVARYLGK